MSKASSDPHMPHTYTSYDSFVYNDKKPFIASFIAPRESGKTYLMEKLLLETKLMKQFDCVIIASPSLKYADMFPIEDKAEGMGVEVFKIEDNFKARIDQLISEIKHANVMHKEKPDKYEEYHALLVLDDIIGEGLASYRNSDNVADELATIGRHFKVSLFASLQTLSALSPNVRRNTTFMFIWSPCNYTDTQRVLEEYVPYEARKEFRMLFDKAFTIPHSFILINNRPENRIYWKKRFYKGFKQYLFPYKEGEENLMHTRKKQKTGEKKEEEKEEEPPGNKEEAEPQE